MALVSEGQEYCSPSKRIKLDHVQQLSNYTTDIDLGRYSASTKDICSSISAEFPVSSCALSSENSKSHVDDDEDEDDDLLNVNGIQQLDSSSATEIECDVTGEGRRKRQLPGPSDENEVEEEEEDDCDDKDEISSTVSNLSNLSGLSDLSGQEWKPIAGTMSWVQKQMLTGVNPRCILNQIVGDGVPVSEQMDDLSLWKIIVNFLSEIPRRQKLRHINTLTDVVRLLRGARKVIILTGAGVSVSCGIPDFRSRDGIYARLSVDFPDLPDPQAMFDIAYFSQDPRPFYKFAREIYPGQFKPSPCHRFIKMLEKHNKLLRNYSQNIDTLEQVAGIHNVIECHGSFATASCTRCKYKVTADAIREDVFAQRIPLCPKCSTDALPSLIDSANGEHYKSLVSQGIMKPDIVFFGEGLPEIFHESMAKDKDECDLLIVIGSSLKVRPVALIPSSIPPHVPQILINREPLPNFNFDVQLLGDSDVIISQICYMLGGDWLEVCSTPKPLTEAKHLLTREKSWRTNFDDTWEERNSDQCPTDYSLDSAKVHPSGHSGRDRLNSKTVTRATSSVSSLAVNPVSSSDGGQYAETSETDSLHMVVDSSLAVTADSTKCVVHKERHMSIDSSTRDSGVCLSVDSPVDNLVADSSRDVNAQVLVTDTRERAAENIGINNSCGRSLHAPRMCNEPSLQPNSTSLSSSQNTILVDPSRFCTEAADSSCAQVECSSGGRSSSISCRHMSVDSTRDSGIGDGCSSIASGVMNKERHMSLDSCDEHQKSEDNLDMLRSCWEPKIRESLATRLPDNSYYFVHPNRYIFPGAEVLYDPDDTQRSSCSSSGSSTSSSDSEGCLSEESDNDEGEVDDWEHLSVSNDNPTNGRCP
ncbi:NAD-dependent protein deacetylase sirtuin-1 isoform X1 [Schistocerca americana]|uniref:NAD-dependent protein deacetylase sirtuin-1 isoform X1 n=1 Tax=Schistocerca americana TaxID=7009 RepID=UPI001F4F99E9|nr:NAD-dependent protein deacetylase sirtuin-1 isoform X1 [Schistocerca americana]